MTNTEKNDQVEQAESEINVILEKYGVAYDYEIDFPMYKTYPPEVALSLQILAKHGMKVIFSLAKK